MLIQFTFANYRSFKSEATLSLVAASKIQADLILDTGNIFLARERPRLSLLRVGALYGANASGKSNVARALATFRRCVLESANLGFKLDPSPFLLDTVSRHEPSLFEITFLHAEAQYRYGFNIKKCEEAFEISSEWLYEAKTTTESRLFERDGDKVITSPRFTEAKALLKDGRLGRKDALFLSMAAQLGTQLTSALVNHIKNGFKIVRGINDEGLHDFTVRCLEQEKHCEQIADLIRKADTGIPKISLDEDGITEVQITFPEGYPPDRQENMQRQMERRFRVIAEHPVFDEQGAQVEVAHFPLALVESEGTQKLFAYAGPILDTLERGSTLIVDEMDARFHPLLTRALVKLFQSSQTNPKNAQLVFITHDTNLLNGKDFRRDQIWFVEKDRFGASHLYSLADFKGVRKGASFGDEYIEGRYGAIPFLGGLERLLVTDDYVVNSQDDEVRSNAVVGGAHAKA